jgi:hypothetical protein
MMDDLHTVPNAAFDAQAGRRDRITQRYARNVLALMAAIRERAAAAEGAARPDEKVSNLEMAKLGLAELEGVAGVAGIELCGLEDARQYLARLEST